MFKNYLTIAIRNLLKHRVYSLINIVGLAVGMVCCVLIALFIEYELGYNHVHENSNRIYRVLREENTTEGGSTFSQRTSGALAPALANDFQEVQQAIRIHNRPEVWVRHEDQGFAVSFTRSDPSILYMFDFPLIKGDRKTALQEPYTALITQETANKLFGSEDPVGKIVTADHDWFHGDFKITGVLKDIPKNSTIRFDLLTATVSEGRVQNVWESWRPLYAVRYYETYVMLQEGYDPKRLIQKLPDFIIAYMGKEIRARNTYHLQPLTHIHLYSRQYKIEHNVLERGNIVHIYLLSAVAFLIMLIACINFMNLATARAVNRGKEVGLRKVVGAYKRQLIFQFLSESVFMSFIALILAIGLVIVLLPSFNGFVQKDLSLDISDSPSMFLSLLGFTLCVGLLSGSYPAFVLSTFRPVQLLKKKVIGNLRGIWLRKGLVVFQFSMSAILMISTAVVYNQLAYVQTKDLGINPEQVVKLGIFNKDPSLRSRHPVVKTAMTQHPNVLNATVHRYSIGSGGGGSYKIVRPEGVEDNGLRMRINEGDEDYLETFGIDLVQGENFSGHTRATDRQAFIVNETAVKKLGWTQPIGKNFDWPAVEIKGTVIGVMKDYHGASLHNKIEPLAIKQLTNANYISIKMRGENISETVAFLEEQWRKLTPNGPVRVVFLDETLGQLYRTEKRMGRIFSLFSVLAIFVACLGLFGLAAYSASQRSREMSIRKVLGASISNVALLLSKEFIKLVIVANLISWPIAYYALNGWLQNFAYHTDLNLSAFLIGGALIVIIALLSVGNQALRVATANPANILRHE